MSETSVISMSVAPRRYAEIVAKIRPTTAVVIAAESPTTKLGVLAASTIDNTSRPRLSTPRRCSEVNGSGSVTSETVSPTLTNGLIIIALVSSIWVASSMTSSRCFTTTFSTITSS